MYQWGWGFNDVDRTRPGNLNVLSLEGSPIVRNIEQPEIRLGGLDSIRKVCENLPLKLENANAVNAVRQCNIILMT
jgi:hypothetical protein